MKTVKCTFCDQTKEVNDGTRAWVCSACVMAGKLNPVPKSVDAEVAVVPTPVIPEVPVSDSVVSSQPEEVKSTKRRRRSYGVKTSKAIEILKLGKPMEESLNLMMEACPRCARLDLRNLLYVTKHRLKKMETCAEAGVA